MNIVLVLHKYSVSIDDPCCYPLGFMYISAVLKQQGHAVSVLNYNLRDYDFVSEVRRADAVLFTGFEEFLSYIKRDALICRNLGIKTILGGALATFKPDEMSQFVDVVVTGEGECVVSKALCSEGIVTGLRPSINDLPFPDYEGFGISEYHKRHTFRYMGVITSRGCPHTCRFCAQTCSYQQRNLSSVFEEIDHYKATYGVTHIVFNDNTLNLNKVRFLAICAGMKLRGLAWGAAIRVDVFDDEMARAAKESGCWYFIVGVESFNDDKLSAMNKRVTADQIRSTLDLLHKYGIEYHGNVLVGLPDESQQDILNELRSLPLQYNIFPVLVQPFVGTQYQNRGINNDEANRLSSFFKEYAESKGKVMYREAA